MVQINTKSMARIAAIQALYNHENTGSTSDINSSLLRMVEYYKDGSFKSDLDIPKDAKIKIKPSYNFLRELLLFSYENLNDIDDIIADHLTNDWSLDKLSVLLKSILRVAIGELKFFPETPAKVIINEYTDIASEMLDDNEIGFVNSLLDKCAAKIRK